MENTETVITLCQYGEFVLTNPKPRSPVQPLCRPVASLSDLFLPKATPHSRTSACHCEFIRLLWLSIARICQSVVDQASSGPCGNPSRAPRGSPPSGKCCMNSSSGSSHIKCIPMLEYGSMPVPAPSCRALPSRGGQLGSVRAPSLQASFDRGCESPTT
jgi:hypothetical protein